MIFRHPVQYSLVGGPLKRVSFDQVQTKAHRAVSEALQTQLLFTVYCFMFTVYCLLFTFYCLLFSCITFHSIKGRQKRESKLIGQCQKPFSDSSIVCLLFRHTLFTYLFLLSIHLKLMYLNVGGEHLCFLQISLFCDHNWSGPPNVKSCDDLAHYNGSGHNTAIWVKICSTIK